MHPWQCYLPRVHLASSEVNDFQGDLLYATRGSIGVKHKIFFGENHFSDGARSEKREQFRKLKSCLHAKLVFKLLPVSIRLPSRCGRSLGTVVFQIVFTTASSSQLEKITEYYHNVDGALYWLSCLTSLSVLSLLHLLFIDSLPFSLPVVPIMRWKIIEKIMFK